MTDHSLQSSSMLQTQTKLIHLFYLHFTISWDQFTRNEWKRGNGMILSKTSPCWKKINYSLLAWWTLNIYAHRSACLLTLHKKTLYFILSPICHALIDDECTHLIKVTFLTGTFSKGTRFVLCCIERSLVSKTFHI